MELVNVNRAAWRRYVDLYGWDALLAVLERRTRFDLFTVSTDWYDGVFLLKAKGARGDLIVRFAD